MAGECTVKTETLLTLQSRLDAVALIWPWLESLALEYRIPTETQFAIDLCLEEAVSNVIRHGYDAQTDQPITVEFKAGIDELTFTIEDHAPPFDPLLNATTENPPVASSIEDFPVGGLGILLMRKFAKNLEYKALDRGNQLAIRFPLVR
jgi:anti-sigma regulatory factor (Ser/Thr protein kinase)